MKKLVTIAALLLTISIPVQAQTSSGQNPKAVDPTTDNNSPKPGINMMTEMQVREKMMESGYTSIQTLTKSSDGIWMGTAMKDNKQVSVMLDYKGDITER